MQNDTSSKIDNSAVCVPGKYNKNTGTCFTKEQLIEMTGAYNRYISKGKLKGGTLIKIKVDPK